MGNYIDYLEWRGDLTLDRDLFNDVDALILSCVSYVDFGGIVPGIGEGEISIKEAAKKYFSKHSDEELARDKSFTKFAHEVLRKMANTKRFEKATLSCYVNILDIKRKLQFAALQIDTHDGSVYIAYRGTDGTIVGWREDFNFSHMTVPAEVEAVEYLNAVQINKHKRIRIGGHSKGGHLAIYAASACDSQIQNRITAIYNQDGPGFNEELINTVQFQAIDSKIIRAIPEDSIIGRLLDSDIKPMVVESSERGIMQHDPSTWQVMGNKYKTLRKPSKTSDLFDKTLTGWISSLDMDKRAEFVDELFSVFEASGEKYFNDIPQCGVRGVKRMLERLNQQPKDTSVITRELLKLFIANWNDRVTESAKSKKIRIETKIETKIIKLTK